MCTTAAKNVRCSVAICITLCFLNQRRHVRAYFSAAGAADSEAYPIARTHTPKLATKYTQHAEQSRACRFQCKSSIARRGSLCSATKSASRWSSDWRSGDAALYCCGPYQSADLSGLDHLRMRLHVRCVPPSVRLDGAAAAAAHRSPHARMRAPATAIARAKMQQGCTHSNSWIKSQVGVDEAQPVMHQVAGYHAPSREALTK